MTTQEEKEQILFVDFEVNGVLGLGELKLIPNSIYTNEGDYDVYVIGDNEYVAYQHVGSGKNEDTEFHVGSGMFWRANSNVKIKICVEDARELPDDLVDVKWRDADKFFDYNYPADGSIVVEETDYQVVWCSKCEVYYNTADINYASDACDHIWLCRSSDAWNTPDEPCGHTNYESCKVAYDNTDND